jgi:hypothetical protein
MKPATWILSWSFLPAFSRPTIRYHRLGVVVRILLRFIDLIEQGLSEVLDDVEWTKPRDDVLGNKDHVWTSSKMAFSPKRTTFDSASGHVEPLFSRGAQLRSLSAHHRQKLGNMMRRIGAGSDAHMSLADRASEINDEVTRQQQQPHMPILTPSDQMILQIQADRRMPTGQIEVKSSRKPYPHESAKTRTSGAVFRMHENEGARTLVNEIILQHRKPTSRCMRTSVTVIPLAPHSLSILIPNLFTSATLIDISQFSAGLRHARHLIDRRVSKWVVAFDRLLYSGITRRSCWQAQFTRDCLFYLTAVA